ncbi:hypothetical protein AB5N19_09094 [Seiridium cardinale]
MAPLLAIDDPAHENFATKTADNARVAFLKKLPLEIRVTIYEYALAEDKPVTPNQATLRSNKFVSQPDSTANRLGLRKMPEKHDLFVSRLKIACRQFYFELESYPVFYRVNSFQFSYMKTLLQFLSAITPQRRSFIRHIVFRASIDDMPLWFPYQSATARHPSYRSDAELHRHATTMLHQCQDLRSFEVQLIVWQAHRSDVTLSSLITSILDGCIRYANHKEGNHQEGEFSGIWTLPSIRPILKSPSSWYREEIPPQFAVDLADPNGSQQPHFEPWISNAAIRILTRNASEAVVSLRKHLSNPNNRVRISESQVRDAITASEVDFPGEDRILQDRFHNTTGAVSTRTRQKCNTDSVNSLGVINRVQSKYNAEGILTWDSFHIHGLRWNNSIIECHVSLVDYAGRLDSDSLSWEILESVLTPTGKEKVYSWYAILSSFVYWSDPARAQEIASQPKPQDVMKIINEQSSDWRIENPKHHKSWVKRWNAMIRKYEQMLEKLAQDVAFAEAEAERLAQEEESRRQTSKKGKKRGSGNTSGGRAHKRRK